MDFIEHVAIAFKQPKCLAAECEHLVTVGGLHDAYQGLGMKGIGDDGELADSPLQLENPEEIRPSKDRQPVVRVSPETAIVGKVMKASQELPLLVRGMFQAQRILESFDEITKPDRVLLVVGMTPMGRLIE